MESAFPLIQRQSIITKVLNAFERQRYVAAICPKRSGLSTVVQQVRNKVTWETEDTRCTSLCVSRLKKNHRLKFCEYFGRIICDVDHDIPNSKHLKSLALFDFLRRLACYSTQRLVLIIDEFDALPIACQKTFLAQTRAFYTDRNTNPEFGRILVMIAGAIDLYDCAPEETSAYNVAEKIYHCDFNLSHDEVKIYTNQLFSALGQYLSPLSLDHIYNLTKGDIGILEQLCGTLAEWGKKKGTTEILVTDVEKAADHVLVEPNEYLESLISQVKSLDSDVKLLLCDILNGRRHTFSRVERCTRKLELLGIVVPSATTTVIKSPLLEKFLRNNIADALPVPVAPGDLLVLSDVEINLRAYGILFQLENTLRNFVLSQLYSKYKNKWLTRIPNTTKWEKAKARQKAATEDSYRNEPVLSIIAYSQFGDLKELIEYNWDIFSSWLSPKQKFAPTYERLEEIRNSIAHSRPLSYSHLQELEIIRDSFMKCFARQ